MNTMLAVHPEGAMFAAWGRYGQLVLTGVEVAEEKETTGDGGGGGGNAGTGEGNRRAVFSVRLSEPYTLTESRILSLWIYARPLFVLGDAAAPSGVEERQQRQQQQQQQQQQQSPRLPREFYLAAPLVFLEPGFTSALAGFRWSFPNETSFPDLAATAETRTWRPPTEDIRFLLPRLPSPPPPPPGEREQASLVFDHLFAVPLYPGGIVSASPRRCRRSPPHFACLVVDGEGTVAVCKTGTFREGRIEPVPAAEGRDFLRAPSTPEVCGELFGGRITAAELVPTDPSSAVPSSFVLWLAAERGAVRRVGVEVVVAVDNRDGNGNGSDTAPLPSLRLRELPPARHNGIRIPPTVALVPLGPRRALVWPREGTAEIVAPSAGAFAFPSPPSEKERDGLDFFMPPRSPVPFRRVLGPVVDVDSSSSRKDGAYPEALFVTRFDEGVDSDDARTLAFGSSSAASVTPGAAATALVSTSGAGSAPGVGGMWSVAVPTKANRSKMSERNGSGSGGGVVMVSFAAASRALAGGGASSFSPSPSTSSPSSSSSPSSLVDATAALGAAADESTLAFGEVFEEEEEEEVAVVLAAHATTARVRLCDASRAARAAAASSLSSSSAPPPILARDFLPAAGSSISAAATSGATGGLVLLSTTGARGVTLLALQANSKSSSADVAPSDVPPFRLDVAAELSLPHEASCLALQQRGEGGEKISKSGFAFELLALVGSYRPGVSLLGVSVTRDARGDRSCCSASVFPLAELSPPPPPRELGLLLPAAATAAAEVAVATAATTTATATTKPGSSPPPPQQPLSSAAAAASSPEPPAPPNVPESAILVSSSSPSPSGGTAGVGVSVLVGWRCGSLSHAAVVPPSTSPSLSSPSPSPWRLEPLTHVKLGSLPVSLRPAPPGLLPPPPPPGNGGGKEGKRKMTAVALAVGEHAAVVSLDPASLSPSPARVSRLNLRGNTAALHAVALWNGAAAAVGCDREEEEEQEETKKPCLLVAGADASLSVVAVSPCLSPLQLLTKMHGGGRSLPSRFSHVAALSFSTCGRSGGGQDGEEEDEGEEGEEDASSTASLPAVVAAASEKGIVFADASTGEVLARHSVAYSETITGLVALCSMSGAASSSSAAAAAAAAAEAKLRACLTSVTMPEEEEEAEPLEDEGYAAARPPLPPPQPRGGMRQRQQRQGLAAALESSSSSGEEDEDEDEEEAVAAAAGARAAWAGAGGRGPVTRGRAAETAAAAAAAATPVAAPEDDDDDAEMLDAAQGEEGGGEEQAEARAGLDGGELPPPPPSAPAPSAPAGRNNTNPVCWLALSSNAEARGGGGTGRIRVLAFEKVAAVAAEEEEENDKDADGGNKNKNKAAPSSSSPSSSSPWRVTLVAHVCCPPDERLHALASLPDGGLAAVVSRRLVLLDVAPPPPRRTAAATAALAFQVAGLRSRHWGVHPGGGARATEAVQRDAAAAMEATAAGAARAPASHPLLRRKKGHLLPRLPALRGSLRTRAVCRLRGGGSALSLSVLAVADDDDPAVTNDGSSSFCVIAVADGGGQRGGDGVSLFAVLAAARSETDENNNAAAAPRAGYLLCPLAASSTPWAASAAMPVAWPSSSAPSNFGVVGGDAVAGRLFALAPPPPLFVAGSGGQGGGGGGARAAAVGAVNSERGLFDASLGRMSGSARVTCAVELVGGGGVDGEDERGRRKNLGGSKGDEPQSPTSTKKKRCREGLFVSTSSSIASEQLAQAQRSNHRHPTWLFGNDAGALLAVRQIPPELGAALLLIQAALESSSPAGAPSPLAIPPSLKRPSICTPSPPKPEKRLPFCPPWASVVADAAGREAAAAVLAAAEEEEEEEAAEAAAGAAGTSEMEREGSLAAAAEAAVAAASMPPLSPRSVGTALAAAVAAVAGNGRGGGAGGTGNNTNENVLAPAPVSTADAPAPFPPLALPLPEEMDDPRRRARVATAMRVATRAFDDTRRATLAAIADGTHPLAERASALLPVRDRRPPSISVPSSSPPSSPPQFLDGDVLASLFDLSIAQRREVLGRLSSGGAVVAELALVAAAGGGGGGGGGSSSNAGSNTRSLAAAALRAAADGEAAAEVVWAALEGLL